MSDAAAFLAGESAAQAAARRRLQAARLAHWRRTRRLTMALLLVWFCATFGAVFFARELSRFMVFGWPLSFYLAAQGASLACLGVLGAYAWAMARIDRRFARMLAERPGQGQ